MRNYDIESPAYVLATRNILAILIPIGYWIAGIGFLLAVRQVRKDIAIQKQALADGESTGSSLNRWRIGAFSLFVAVLAGLTIALLVTSLVIN